MTHLFVTRLKNAGFVDTQAEAISDAFKLAQSESQPITKNYFDAKLKAEIGVAKSEVVKWVIGLSLAQIGLLVGLLLKLGF
ncbi:MAG: hypothetical protein WCG34_13325 [Leptolinea sp.]